MSDENTKTLEVDIWLEEFLTGLLEHTGLDIWIAEMDIDENSRTYTVQLDGDDKARAIGRDGQMINSIQHLCIAAAANKDLHDVKIIVDVDGYRERRDSKLETDARQLAKEVVTSGSTLDMDPMCARDRRMVHMIVSGIEGVRTESAGRGRDRYIRIIPQLQES